MFIRLTSGDGGCCARASTDVRLNDGSGRTENRRCGSEYKSSGQGGADVLKLVAAPQRGPQLAEPVRKTQKIDVPSMLLPQ